MQFFSMGSGSCGNCYYLREDGYGIVVDMGIALRSFKKYFRDYGFSLAEVKALLVTHDHTDHVKGAGALSQDLHLPVFASQPVQHSMSSNPFMGKKVEEGQFHTFAAGDTLNLGPFCITAFHVPHDASDNNGFFIETAHTNFCLMTDVGSITPDMAAYIRRARNLVIEANYDEAMLESGPYPYYLRRRIRSGRGHSSNKQTATALAENLSEDIRRVWLCHLSEENNHPELARKTVEEALRLCPVIPELHVLKRSIPSGVFEL